MIASNARHRLWGLGRQGRKRTHLGGGDVLWEPPNYPPPESLIITFVREAIHICTYSMYIRVTYGRNIY
jgi:hypothetical protein